MRVRVFRNLTTKSLSIMARVANANGRKGWRTIAHAQYVTLGEPRPYVSAAGRKRVIDTGRKHVHAWVEGYLIDWMGEMRSAAQGLSRIHMGCLEFGRVMSTTNTPALLTDIHPRVTYNPHKNACFVTRDGGCVAEIRPVHSALTAWMFATGEVFMARPQ
jgi:hypothetical protein